MAAPPGRRLSKSTTVPPWADRRIRGQRRDLRGLRSNIAGDGTFHQVSRADGGVTWAASDRFDDGGGMSGLPSFGLDTTGTLHYVIGPVKYASWQAGRLSDYVDVATEDVRQAATLSSGEAAVLAITSGNRVHVFFEHDFQNVWIRASSWTSQHCPRRQHSHRPRTGTDAIAPAAGHRDDRRGRCLSCDRTRRLVEFAASVEPPSPGKPLILAMIPTLGLLLVVVKYAFGKEKQMIVENVSEPLRFRSDYVDDASISRSAISSRCWASGRCYSQSL